jgi:hypothetical protein
LRSFFELIDEFINYSKTTIKTAFDKLKVIVVTCKPHKIDDLKIRKIVNQAWGDAGYTERHLRRLLSEHYPELVNSKFANKDKTKPDKMSASSSQPQQDVLPQNIVEVMEEKEKGDDTDTSKPKFFDISLLRKDGYIIPKKANRLPEYRTSGTFVKCDYCGMFVHVRESGFGKEGWDIKNDAIPLVPSNKYFYDTFWYCYSCYSDRKEIDDK